MLINFIFIIFHWKDQRTKVFFFVWKNNGSDELTFYFSLFYMKAQVVYLKWFWFFKEKRKKNMGIFKCARKKHLSMKIKIDFMGNDKERKEK